MLWNWELPDWPHFKYQSDLIASKERRFLLNIGVAVASLKAISSEEQDQFLVEILSSEGLESSSIEGEILDRESMQSSIRKHFGLQSESGLESNKESGMSKLLFSVYESFDKPLTHQMLCGWHAYLFENSTRDLTFGRYRTHEEPMQIVSRRYDSPTVFFEAPPSNKMNAEMETFVNWFNRSHHSGSLLGHAAIAHVYFESIHPFEDGNGRIGRALVEKLLSQGVKKPVLIAISKTLEKRKKDYYEALGRCNKTLEVDHWVDFFTDVIVDAQQDSLDQLCFLIEKSKFLTALRGRLNPRQEKALMRMFGEGPSGFLGGMSADKYIAMTHASRATATRDLADLVEKGALVKTGELRHTRYWLAKSAS